MAGSILSLTATSMPITQTLVPLTFLVIQWGRGKGSGIWSSYIHKISKDIARCVVCA